MTSPTPTNVLLRDVTKESNSMKRKFFNIIAFLLMIVLGMALSQCSDDPLAPFQPEITSATDNFQLQATGVKSQTATLIYSWNNTGTRATVAHSTTTSTGTARLIIKDDGGNSVYDKLLVPSLTDTTATGSAGGWKIYLVLTRYSGTLNFRAQKL
jgi:hypothetical protein